MSSGSCGLQLQRYMAVHIGGRIFAARCGDSIAGKRIGLHVGSNGSDPVLVVADCERFSSTYSQYQALHLGSNGSVPIFGVECCACTSEPSESSSSSSSPSESSSSSSSESDSSSSSSSSSSDSSSSSSSSSSDSSSSDSSSDSSSSPANCTGECVFTWFELGPGEGSWVALAPGCTCGCTEPTSPGPYDGYTTEDFGCPQTIFDIGSSLFLATDFGAGGFDMMEDFA